MSYVPSDFYVLPYLTKGRWRYVSKRNNVYLPLFHHQKNVCDTETRFPTITLLMFLQTPLTISVNLLHQ